ncbi:MAG: FHA domain-containing protein, partial [Pirellulales bacterium]|nr:FHA domain-containing protein [Pirellulales bacterium]
MNAYLIIRDGSKWADVVRLIPGESVTMGRAPTNTVVVKDERCSRNHAEVFHTQGMWKIRDLDSRNGTQVSGERLSQDHVLEPGDILQIGNSHLAYVEDLSQAFPETGSLLKASKSVSQGTDLEGIETEDAASIFETFEPTTITHRKE